KVVLSTTRGRQFSFFYPWPVTPPSGGNTGGTFQTNIGPLSIFFDFKSFNFTQGSQTQSQPAWCLPSGATVLLYLKLVNQATDSRNDNWLTLIDFSYLDEGKLQGQTIPFMDWKDTAGYPGTC